MQMPGGQYVTDTLHSGVTEAANGRVVKCVDPVMGGLTILTVQIKGIVDETAYFEATVNGTDWVGLQATNVASGVAGVSAAADGVFRMNVLGLPQVRVRLGDGASTGITVSAVAVS